MNDTERLDTTEAALRELTRRLDAMEQGEFHPGGEGFRIGTVRLFEKPVSAEYHLHQRDEDGAESDLTGAKSLWGIPISETPPTAGQLYAYNAATGQWEPTSPGAPGAHALGGAAHTADTLAHLNTKVSDATLDDHGDSRPPTGHTHDDRYYTEGEHGGVSPQGHHDEGHQLEAAGGPHTGSLPWGEVSGKPGTFPPSAHKASHQNGGGDEINVGGLSGALADNQPSDHATPIAAHAGAADPHTGYQKESEKGAANGYAGLTAGTKLLLAQMQEVMGYADLTDDLAILKTLLTTRGDMIRRGAAAPERFAKGTSGKYLRMGANDPDWQWDEAGIAYVIDGGGSVIETGVAGGLEVPFDCFVTGWTILAIDGLSGSIVVDVWADTYASHPPTVADTIAGTEKPTINASNKGQDLSLSSWTQALTKGDVLFFNVDSIATLERAALSLRVLKYRTS